MNVEVPGTSTGIRLNDDGSVTLYTIGQPPSGQFSVTYDPSVTKDAVVNTISALAQMLPHLP